VQITTSSFLLANVSDGAEFVRLDRAAGILGINQRTVRYHISTGALPAYKLGYKIWIVRLDDVYQLKRRLEDFHA
jgi:predicted site-specific integrase-resolvase